MKNLITRKIELMSNKRTPRWMLYISYLGAGAFIVYSIFKFLEEPDVHHLAPCIAFLLLLIYMLLEERLKNKDLDEGLPTHDELSKLVDHKSNITILQIIPFILFVRVIVAKPNLYSPEMMTLMLYASLVLIIKGYFMWKFRAK